MTHPTHYQQQYSSYYDRHPGIMQPRPRVMSPPRPQGQPLPQRASQRSPQPKLRPRRRPKFLWAGASGGMVAFAALVVTPQVVSPEAAATTVCAQRVETQSVLSRDELSELLAVPERSSREAVEAVIAEPFCVLNQTEIRAGIPAERVAYPLAFDPQTWLIVLYEEGEYAGYDFSFTRE